MSSPSATVVVPFRREGALLAGQLAALDAQVDIDEFDVILAGSAPDDRSRCVARRWAASRSHAHVVASPVALLPGATRNLGAAAATTEVLAFCDADDVVAPEWLAAHVDTLARPEVAASGGPLDESTLNPLRVRRWREPLVADALPEGWWFRPYAVSANLAIRRSVFASVGGFDPNLRSCEDVDLSWRIAAANLALVFTPGATVRYRHRHRLLASIAQAYRWGYDSVALVGRHRALGGTPRHVGPVTSLRMLAADVAAIRPLGAGRLLRDIGYVTGLAVASATAALTNCARPAGQRSPYDPQQGESTEQ